MNKSTINFKAPEGQELERVENLKHYAPDTKNYIEAHFELGPQWQGFEKVYAAWYIGDHAEFTDIPENGIVVIPESVLSTPGLLEMNLVGENYVAPGTDAEVVKERMPTFPVEVLKLSYKQVR